MTNTHIQQSVERVVQMFREHPERRRSTDKAAVAVIEQDLRCRAEGPGGAVLITDMARGLGGGATAPSPSWFFRAALATCDASMIALRAAQLGITLTTLEVTVESESDDAGLLGIDDSAPAGALQVRTTVRIGSEAASSERLRELVSWAETHSPVGDMLRRAVPTTLSIEIADGNGEHPEDEDERPIAALVSGPKPTRVDPSSASTASEASLMLLF